MTPTPPQAGERADIHPDDSGPYLCECCDADHSGPRDPAEEAGWRMSWDGWICPECCKQLEEPHARLH